MPWQAIQGFVTRVRPSLLLRVAPTSTYSGRSVRGSELRVWRRGIRRISEAEFCRSWNASHKRGGQLVIYMHRIPAYARSFVLRNINQPPFPMKAQLLLPAIATLILFSCSSAPQTTEPAATAPPASVTTPVDTAANRYERKEVQQIQRDTAKVGLPLGAE